MSRVTLDAGALIALERGDRPMWAALRIAANASDELVVPSTVLAQVWRNRPSQARLAKVLQLCAIAGFDRVAKQVGELCAQTGTSDICDAHVALVSTALAGSVLYTSDLDDLRLLTRAVGRNTPVLVRC